MDKSHFKQPKKANFPKQNRWKDTKHRLYNPEHQPDYGIDSSLDPTIQEPDRKKPRLGGAPAEHLRRLNQIEQQTLLGHNPQGFRTEANETSTIYKSMHTVMEQMNEIVDEAKLVVGAMNRISTSVDVNKNSPGTSRPIPSCSQMKGKESKTKCTKLKDDEEKVDLGKIGQRRKHGSEFGTIDSLAKERPRPLRSARRLIFGPEENELMDCDD